MGIRGAFYSIDQAYAGFYADKIAEGKSPFAPIGERLEGNRLIYELTGTDQVHYYFQSGKLLVWMAANPELAEQALGEVLKFYP